MNDPEDDPPPPPNEEMLRMREEYLEVKKAREKEKNMIAFKELLARNYAALGFELLDLEYLSVSPFLHREPIGDEMVIRGKILCPCGGIEVFAFVGDVSEVNHQKFAFRTLSATASREHLEADIAAGLLSPFDLEGHIFKELI
jgi:hypothetical protein